MMVNRQRARPWPRVARCRYIQQADRHARQASNGGDAEQDLYAASKIRLDFAAGTEDARRRSHAA